MGSRLEEMLNTAKLNELFHKKQMEEEKKNSLLWILAIIGAVAAVAGIAYAVYHHLNKDCLEDFDDDFDEEYNEDFYDDEDTASQDKEDSVEE